MYLLSRRLLWLFLLLSAPCLCGVIIKGPAPSPSAPPSLLQLTQRAGFIFSGTVLSIERIEPKAQNEVATVRITFRVDQAVRGVSSRQTFAIREWAGLWDSGDRYRTGEQVLLFLYQSSKLGLTSPVNGNFGHFKLDKNGKILLDAQRLAALQIKIPTTDPLSGKRFSLSSRDLVRAVRRVGD